MRRSPQPHRARGAERKQVSQEIFIVTQGEYSDYRIVGVFSSKEKAEAHARDHTVAGVVEPYPLDALVGRDYKHLVCAHIDLKSGEVPWLHLSEPVVSTPSRVVKWEASPTGFARCGDGLRVSVCTHSVEHGKKLVTEARQEFIRLHEVEHLTVEAAIEAMNRRTQA